MLVTESSAGESERDVTKLSPGGSMQGMYSKKGQRDCYRVGGGRAC